MAKKAKSVTRLVGEDRKPRERSSSKYIFQKIAREGQQAGVEPGDEFARDWFRDRAMELKRVDARRIMTQKDRLRTNLTGVDIGRMFMYFYNPKWEKKLPYYDRFPLIFMIEKYNDGWLGINLHYLPPMFRARLMDALYTLEKDDTMTEGKKLKVTYNLLKSASKFKYFKPCVKRYLSGYAKSRFLTIPSSEWDIALMMPTERFKKARKQTVWKDSKKIIQGKM